MKTNRQSWLPALSVGPGAMNAASFDRLAKAGIFQLELSSGSAAPFFEELDYPRRAAAISALAREHGVEISSIHLPFGPFSELDPAAEDAGIRRRLIEKQTELIEAAGEAGVGIAVIHPSGEPYREEERAERLAVACETIAALTEIAGKAGVTLALENLPRTCLCRTSDEMLFFLERIPALRVCFDTNHSLTESNAHYIETVGEKIVTLHVSDYDFVDEKHWLPMEGKNDWQALLGTLENVGYAGRFLYECGGGQFEKVAENQKMLLNL